MKTRSFIAIVIAGAAVALTTGAASAAAPRIVIVSGQPLAHQIVISSWPSIFGVVEQVATARVVQRSQLAHRPRLTFSMFWGPRWIEYLSTGHRASDLRPREADQLGSFYPAWNGRPAVIDLPWAGQWPRLVPGKALVTLKHFGVPTTVR